jgi:outer membrane protein assembly factor BamD (BamD/ComL family)
MYNRAHYLDFELKDTVLAKQYYLEFMDTYPNSEFVSSAQARLDQHFMSAEELIELWTK